MSDTSRGQVAATAAEVYEEFFVPALFEQWAERMVEAGDISQGGHVLDVGCGTGVLARRALGLAGPSGRVVGIDPNDGMLAVARNTPDVEWMVGTAENLPFEHGSFDSVVSQFAIMFFDDRGRAIREMRRVLRPRGRVAIATWGSLQDTPGYAAMVGLLDRLFGSGAGDALRAPYSLEDPDELHDLLASDFEDVDVREMEGVARFDSIDDWVHTDIRGWTLSDLSDTDYETLLGAARTDLVQYVQADGSVAFSAPALIAVGTASG